MLQIVSNLRITLYAIKGLTSKKLRDLMQFKFQWHIEKFLKKLGLVPGFGSMSLLGLKKRKNMNTKSLS